MTVNEQGESILNIETDRKKKTIEDSLDAKSLTIGTKAIGVGSHAKVYLGEYFGMPVAVKVYDKQK